MLPVALRLPRHHAGQAVKPCGQRGRPRALRAKERIAGSWGEPCGTVVLRNPCGISCGVLAGLWASSGKELENISGKESGKESGKWRNSREGKEFRCQTGSVRDVAPGKSWKEFARKSSRKDPARSPQSCRVLAGSLAGCWRVSG